MNILVTGANGQLGNEMRIVAKGSSDQYIFTDVTEQEGVQTTFLDITDLDAIRTLVKEKDVRAIVNCAAWTNVDAAEAPENRALVEKLNAEAPENLARADIDRLRVRQGALQHALSARSKGHTDRRLRRDETTWRGEDQGSVGELGRLDRRLRHHSHSLALQ